MSNSSSQSQAKRVIQRVESVRRISLLIEPNGGASKSLNFESVVEEVMTRRKREELKANRIKEMQLSNQFRYFKSEFLEAAASAGVTVPLDLVEDNSNKVYNFITTPSGQNGPKYIYSVMQSRPDATHLMRCSISLLLVTISLLRIKLENVAISQQLHDSEIADPSTVSYNIWAAEALDKLSSSSSINICSKLLKKTHIPEIQDLVLRLLAQLVTISQDASDCMLGQHESSGAIMGGNSGETDGQGMSTGTAVGSVHSTADYSCLSHLLSVVAYHRNRYSLHCGVADIIIMLVTSMLTNFEKTSNQSMLVPYVSIDAANASNSDYPVAPISDLQGDELVHHSDMSSYSKRISKLCESIAMSPAYALTYASVKKEGGKDSRSKNQTTLPGSGGTPAINARAEPTKSSNDSRFTRGMNPFLSRDIYTMDTQIIKEHVRITTVGTKNGSNTIVRNQNNSKLNTPGKKSSKNNNLFSNTGSNSNGTAKGNSDVIEWAGLKIFLKFLARYSRYIMAPTTVTQNSRTSNAGVNMEEVGVGEHGLSMSYVSEQPQENDQSTIRRRGGSSGGSNSNLMSPKEHKELLYTVIRVLTALSCLILYGPAVQQHLCHEMPSSAIEIILHTTRLIQKLNFQQQQVDIKKAVVSMGTSDKNSVQHERAQLHNMATESLANLYHHTDREGRQRTTTATGIKQGLSTELNGFILKCTSMLREYQSKLNGNIGKITSSGSGLLSPQNEFLQRCQTSPVRTSTEGAMNQTANLTRNGSVRVIKEIVRPHSSANAYRAQSHGFNSPPSTILTGMEADLAPKLTRIVTRGDVNEKDRPSTAPEMSRHRRSKKPKVFVPIPDPKKRHHTPRASRETALAALQQSTALSSREIDIQLESNASPIGSPSACLGVSNQSLHRSFFSTLPLKPMVPVTLSCDEILHTHVDDEYMHSYIEDSAMLVDSEIRNLKSAGEYCVRCTEYLCITINMEFSNWVHRICFVL